jgi:hypothetical protein
MIVATGHRAKRVEFDALSCLTLPVDRVEGTAH